MRGFTAIDLTPQCEVCLEARYEYELLERIEGASELIGAFSGEIWKNSQTFDVKLLASNAMQLRWRALAKTAGIAVVSDGKRTLSISLLASGQDPDADSITLNAFQTHVVHNLKNTGFEPAFDLQEIWQRPLIATIGLFMPEGQVNRRIFALTDRCFAAAYFRRLGLV